MLERFTIFGATKGWLLVALAAAAGCGDGDRSSAKRGPQNAGADGKARLTASPRARATLAALRVRHFLAEPGAEREALLGAGPAEGFDRTPGGIDPRFGAAPAAQ